MMRNALLFLALSGGAVWAQSADTPDVFEVVSIKPSAPQGADGRYYSGCARVDPGRITCTNTTLYTLLAMAYRISDTRISGLKPPLLAFDIVAKVPAGATPDRVKRMWQNFLAERFKLAVHREKREMPVYLLVAAKGGPKVKESVDEPGSDASGVLVPNVAKLDKEGFPVVPPGTSVASFGNGAAHFAASKVSIEQFSS